ncbi:Mur ligase family protein [Mollicutes bacterium LVI A0039]|nr:Mur ligase family protein [Mollicutes bacterium LVI A0039]
MNDIIAKIESHSKFGIKLGLENMTKTLAVLDNPQDKMKIIHIAGTNGKGSVSSFISSSLQAAGYSVAKYCSPYLISLEEMFVINDQSISLNDLEQYYQQIIAAATELNLELTLYEITTTIMFLHAANSKVDYLVLEVGLGGRLDATNVCMPVASVITNISLDHTHILGDTITEIATEKAGIIKPGVPLFTTETNPEAVAVFRLKTSDIHIVDSHLEYELDLENFNTIVKLADNTYKLNLFGSHQVANFALALAVLNHLNISGDAIKSGVAKTVHQARLEQLSSNIIFDGAHNRASARALVDSLSETSRPIRVIFSMLSDKDVPAVVAILQELSDDLVFIPLPHLERGISEEAFAKYQFSGIKIASDIDQAVADDKLNLICGTFSLYPLVKAYLQ